MLRPVYCAAAALVLGLVSFAVLSSAGVALVMLWAAVAGVAAFVFVRLIDGGPAETPTGIAAMATAGGALLIGVALVWLTGVAQFGWYSSLAILVAMGSCWALQTFLSDGKTQRCFVCKQSTGPASFVCPRCHQLICPRPTCWIGRQFRCRRCEDREVIIFPLEESWWSARLGPRLTTGSCGKCLKEAHEMDLRACKRCRWPMCKRCWDERNGRCDHCGLFLPDLPAELRPFVGSSEPTKSARGAAAARRKA
jgi:hypothetical protein